MSSSNCPGNQLSLPEHRHDVEHILIVEAAVEHIVAEKNVPFVNADRRVVLVVFQDVFDGDLPTTNVEVSAAV